jgi:outer membrane protein OmpA-like peptidoglycan-associated protein
MRHIISSLLFISAFCVVSLNTSGQRTDLCPESSSKKAVKYYKSAESAKKSRKDYGEIKKLISKAIAEDSSYALPYYLLGNLAYVKKDFKTMRNCYEELIELCPDISELIYYRLGKYYYNEGEPKPAIKYLKAFQDFNSEKEKLNAEVEVMLYRSELMADPVSFEPAKVEGLNTMDPEYLPFISPDNEFCFFTRRYDEFKKGELTPKSVEKFMFSQRDTSGVFDKGQPMPSPFNQSSSNNEGGPTITKDNRILYFTYNYDGNFDLYYSEWTIDGWGPINNMGENVNDPMQWDSQPTVSSDGSELYYASYRDSVNMTSDIFRTRRVNGEWTRPERMPFNTNGNEKTPFIHPDNRTLYFASDSLQGMGGYDIYVVRKDKNGEWSEPKNIGYPINTGGDEVGFIISTDGRKGYFASNTIQNTGGYDIYYFELPEPARPERVLFLKGDLRDAENNIPLAAKIELKNLQTQEVLDVDYDTTTGKYASVVLFDADYIMTVKQKGHAYNSAYFSKEDTSLNEPVKVDFNMQKIEVGGTYKLNNIFFATNSSELNGVSRNILSDFSEFLNSDKRIHVAIHGHTDNIGGAEPNLKLSKERAQSVYDHLISLGIDRSRLSYKGFGQSKPVDSNDTAEGRARNRRTEFVIIKK